MFFRLALSGISYQRLTSPTASATNRAENPRDWEFAQRIQRLTRLASQLHFPTMTCLPQALALRWMLNRRGIPAHIRIGVWKDKKIFQAHAWVEAQGRPIGDPENIPTRFNVLSESNLNFSERVQPFSTHSSH